MTDNVTVSAFNVKMTSPVDFSTGDIWRAASDKSPVHRGSEARHRRAWKGLWKVKMKLSRISQKEGRDILG